MPGSITLDHWQARLACGCHIHAKAKAMALCGTYRGNLSRLRNALKKRVQVLRGLVWRDLDLNVIHLPLCFTMDPAQVFCKV